MNRSSYCAAVAAVALLGCASRPAPPPLVDLDEPGTPTAAIEVIAAEPPVAVEVVEVPTPLPLPGQLKPVEDAGPVVTDLPDAKKRVERANLSARVEPTRDGYINAVQVWPYSAGALYQVYASPGKVTDIALQPGEELVALSAGDTVRWVVGDTTSGAGATQRVHVLLKPARAGIATNLVVLTNRRVYHLEATATERTWMASVSWNYPADIVAALRAREKAADAATPVASGLQLERLRFRYAITGDKPAWRPLRAFDDGERVYIQFPAGIAQGEMPPLFVVGPAGDTQLVNYRVRSPYYVVDRLFGAAELRLGAQKQEIVRIARTDSRKPEPE
jgi:type IV secretion system protein TrbG